MTPGENDDLERGGDDLLAAEYVLGVLPADERREVAQRIERDADFARVVEMWEGRFSSLNAGYAEVDPPAAVKADLDTRLFGAGAGKAQPSSGMLGSLAFWRGLAIASVAALLAFAVWTAAPYMRPAGAPQDERLVASLASDETDVSYLVVYDDARGEIAMSHVAGDRAPERDFELWVIGGDEVLSLGVVPVGENIRMAVAPDMREKIAPGMQFAITLEPLGGAPEGVATGPIVAAGDLRTI